MMAFDSVERSDMFIPARVSRGMGAMMLNALVSAHDGVWPGREPRELHWRNAGSRRGPDAGDGLEAVASRLAGQQGLVFLVSDFHWPLERLGIVFDYLAHATVVPVVVWDPAETEPPARNALASLRDAESGARRTLWVRPRLREEWRRGVAGRRAEINSMLAARNLHPFYMEGDFDADALSRYFFEADT